MSKLSVTLCSVAALAAWASVASAQWNVQAIGTGLTTPFDVKVGDARNDGRNRVYVSERNGRVMEWTYTGTAWSNRVLATGVKNLALLAIGSVRGDGLNRLYYSEFNAAGALYELRWTGSAWVRALVDNTYSVLNLFIGPGRNDGVNRLYVGSNGDANKVGRGLWEYTGTNSNNTWTKFRLHASAMEGAGAVGNLRNDGIQRVLGNTSILDDLTWTGSAYVSNTIDHSSFLYPDPTVLGALRNDGRTRVIINSNGQQGRVEYSCAQGVWSKRVIDATIQRGDVSIARLKADGLNRLYATYTTKGGVKGPLREFTWNAGTSTYTSNTVVDGVTGATAMIGVGNGRNDGVARLYTPDYGGGRLLEITSTSPFIYASPRNDLRISAARVVNGQVLLAITNLTSTCSYVVSRSTDLTATWSNAASFTAASTVTNWSTPAASNAGFYKVTGHPNY